MVKETGQEDNDL